MKNVKNKKMMAVVLPEGCFYGNCSDCVYADRSDWRDGEVYCLKKSVTFGPPNADKNTDQTIVFWHTAEDAKKNAG